MCLLMAPCLAFPLHEHTLGCSSSPYRSKVLGHQDPATDLLLGANPLLNLELPSSFALTFGCTSLGSVNLSSVPCDPGSWEANRSCTPSSRKLVPTQWQAFLLSLLSLLKVLASQVLTGRQSLLKEPEAISILLLFRLSVCFFLQLSQDLCGNSGSTLGVKGAGFLWGTN